ncbi:MAG TPA: hypothetical protein VED63_05295 [Acidimicrobiales bacterium]|nr:hypothetical protein [Acidimicrobiales bacterium]
MLGEPVCSWISAWNALAVTVSTTDPTEVVASLVFVVQSPSAGLFVPKATVSPEADTDVEVEVAVVVVVDVDVDAVGDLLLLEQPDRTATSTSTSASARVRVLSVQLSTTDVFTETAWARTPKWRQGV